MNNSNNQNNRPRRRRNIKNDNLRINRQVRNNRKLATRLNLDEDIKAKSEANQENIKPIENKEEIVETTPIKNEIVAESKESKQTQTSNDIVENKEDSFLTEKEIKSESKARAIYNKHVKSQIPKVIIFAIAIITIIIFSIFAYKYSNDIIETGKVNESVNQVVDKYIDDIQANYSTTVQPNPIAENDVVVFDLLVYYDGQSYDDNPVKQRLIIRKSDNNNEVEQKIMDALIGKKVGDKVKVTVDAENQSFTQAVFDIKIKNVYKLAEINDALVQKFVKENVEYIDQDVRKEFSQISTVDQLKAYLTKIIKNNLKQQELVQQNQGIE